MSSGSSVSCKGFIIELVDNEIAGVASGTLHLWVFGYIQYLTFMGGEQIDRFCFRWVKSEERDDEWSIQRDGDAPKAYVRRGEQNDLQGE